MTAPTRERPPAAIHRSPRIALLTAVVLTGGLAAGVLTSSDDTSPTERVAVTPLPVTAGSEIATGFAVGRDRVLTVAHVVDGAGHAVDGGVREGGTGAIRVNGIRARVLRVDRRSDLALLALPEGAGAARGSTWASEAVRERAGTPPAVAEAGAGERVRLVPLRDGGSSPQSVRVRRAIVAHVRAAGAARAVTRPALELAAHVRAGDSGAPVESRSGALVGVVFAASSRRESTAYAVDASAVTRLLARD
jgi:Trypsin-like peptidase domain